MSKEQEYQRARRAQELLEDDVVQELLIVQRDRYVKQWIAAETAEAREQCWALVKAVEAFKKDLKIEADKMLVAAKRQEP